MKLQCVITDDEPIALEILEDYIKLIPNLILLAKCTNAIETMSVLQKNEVDILFIDIKMPGISGIELVKSLKKPPAIIFTTAFPDYAIDGFDLNAVDYLLKPISIDRFLRSVNKVVSNTHKSNIAEIDIPRKEANSNFLFVKSGHGFTRIYYEEIYYIEALENYVRIHLKDKFIISFISMKNLEDVLPARSFLRIHRSYIVNLEKVDTVQNFIFKLGNKSLGSGKSYRKAIGEVFRNFHIGKK